MQLSGLSDPSLPLHGTMSSFRASRPSLLPHSCSLTSVLLCSCPFPSIFYLADVAQMRLSSFHYTSSSSRCPWINSTSSSCSLSESWTETWEVCTASLVLHRAHVQIPRADTGQRCITAPTYHTERRTRGQVLTDDVPSAMAAPRHALYEFETSTRRQACRQAIHPSIHVRKTRISSLLAPFYQ